MGDETHVNEDFGSGSPIENPGNTSYGVFSGSQHFTVAGGTFTNTSNTTNNYHTAPTVASDFRRIPMGEIDLQREICLDKHSNVAEYRRERRSVRRLYSAKIDGRKSSVTVATYQGESAEEEWRRDVAKYMAVRHPNIVQLCGTASCGNIYATLFNDDLIPLQDFALNRHSLLSAVYIYAYANVEFKGIMDYFHSTFLHPVFDVDCTFLIRRSTGRICVDLTPGNTCVCRYIHLNQRSDQPEFKLLSTPSLEVAALGFLMLEEYHEICYWQFSHYRNISVHNPITVNLGAVISCLSGNRLEDLVEIAFLPQTDPGSTSTGWIADDLGVVMENGWTRLRASDTVANTTLSLSVGFLDRNSWLSQANHIFKQLGISSNFEDYVILERVWFGLSIPPSGTAAPLEGFLFLCPPTDFQTGPSSFKWPECPSHWSFDPTGADPLSLEDAANLGFPSLQLSITVLGRSWDASVYAGLHQFHQAKGFDPDSQDVVRHLGCPLYEFSSEINVPFAHIDDENFSRDRDEPTRVTWEEESENGSESSDSNQDASDTSPSLSDLADALPVSLTLELLIYVRLSLVLGLVLSWLNDHVWSRI